MSDCNHEYESIVAQAHLDMCLHCGQPEVNHTIATLRARIAELEAENAERLLAQVHYSDALHRMATELAALREAAATYKNNGHSPSCRRHTLYTKGGRCICGYDELAALLKQEGE